MMQNQRVAPFVGREAELALLAEPDEGRPGRLVLGTRGMGKTALIDEAAERMAVATPELLVLRARAGEGKQPYSLARPLLAPLAPLLPSLPRSAATLIEDVAAGRQPAPAQALGFDMGLHALFVAAASRGPLLVVVDDVHHADVESQRALAFVARRVDGLPLRFLFAGRGETVPPAFHDRFRLLRLGPLAPTDAARLVDALPTPPSRRSRLDVLKECAGHPAALVALTAAAAGCSTVEAACPSAAADAGHDRALRRLPPDTLSLVLYAAVAGQAAPVDAVMRAAGPAGCVANLTPAEDAGIVTVRDGRVSFADPPTRWSVLAGAAPQLRQAVHRRVMDDLAAASPADAIRLAHGTRRRDDRLAARFEDVGHCANRRREGLDAARAFEAAAWLSPLPADRSRRYALAMMCASDYGDHDWAMQLGTSAGRNGADDTVHAAVATLKAWGLSGAGRQRRALEVLQSNVSLDVAVPPAARTTLARVVAGIVRETGCAVAREAAATLRGASTPRSAPEDASDDLAAPRPWTCEWTHCETDLRAAGRPVDPQTQGAVAERLIADGILAVVHDQQTVAVERFERVLAGLDLDQAAGTFRDALVPYATAVMDVGRLTDAARIARAAQEWAISHRAHRITVQAAAVRARTLALRGNAADARFLLDDVTDLIDLSQNRATRALVLQAEATASWASGDLESTRRHLRALFGRDGEPLDRGLSPLAIPDLVRADVTLGRSRDTARVVDGLQRAVKRRTRRARLRMQLASALLGGPDADAYFTAVVTDADSEQWPFEHAMARLQYAAWLRRSHQEQPARAALHAALDTFTQLGIPIMKAHTAAELRASGVATAPPAYGEFNRLTPQQQSIVRLVASGLHNPEVAARLHLSTHTVRSHLYRLFPRLGVTDRAQLRNVVPHGEAMA